jgi:HKD family nuclease
MPFVVKLDVIENSGPDNLRDAVKTALKRASDACLAVAFVTQSGLGEIIQSLRQVAASGTVRFITGPYQSHTEPEALRTLLRVQEETRGQFAVRLSKEPKFHRKLYLVRNSSHWVAIVGSSNLTRDGLRSGGELNLIARLSKASRSVRTMTQAFEDDWQHRSVPLVARQIEQYSRLRPQDTQARVYSRTELAKILGDKPSHREATAEKTQAEGVDLWRDCITGYVKKRTEQVIAQTTNWDDKNYWWFGADSAHPYKIGDQVFQFDFPDRRLRLVRIKDVARTTIRTPDGRHFIAYLPDFRRTRRFSKKLWTLLQSEGINRKNARRRTKLSPRKAKRLEALLRRPSKK